MKETSNENINILLGDVGELKQVRDIVSKLQEKESIVHCLVCNAGVLLNDRKETSEGNEITFASHLLGGSFLLSQLLLPQLHPVESSGGRVIFVSSGGMYTSKFPDWDHKSQILSMKYVAKIIKRLCRDDSCKWSIGVGFLARFIQFV